MLYKCYVFVGMTSDWDIYHLIIFFQGHIGFPGSPGEPGAAGRKVGQRTMLLRFNLCKYICKYMCSNRFLSNNNYVIKINFSLSWWWRRHLLFYLCQANTHFNHSQSITDTLPPLHSFDRVDLYFVEDLKMWMNVYFILSLNRVRGVALVKTVNKENLDYQ